MPKPSTITDRRTLYFIILVNIMVPLGGMSTDIYLPSLPAIGMHFGVGKDLAQLTVSAYVIALGISQLIVGPISDAYGRKKLLFLAIFSQLLAVIGILFSPSIYWMICFRFMQGLGAAFMMVPARAILTDIFYGHELKKQFNYVTISFSLGPIIAPFIGGYLQHYFGWQANFVFILIYISIVILLLFIYQETMASSRTFSIHHLWQNYHLILKNRVFLETAFFVAMIWGYGALFTVLGPFLIQMALHLSAIAYGRIALIIGVAWFLGNMFNRILFHYDKRIKTQIALWLTFTAATAMLVLGFLSIFNISALIIPTFVIIMLSGFMFPVYIGECLVIFSDLAASANACLFSLMWIGFGFFTVLGTQLKIHSLLPLSIAFLSLSIINFILYYKFLIKHEIKNEKHTV